jgi:phosphoglycerol transferase MdoB-like AlkP superfamily enzyme
MLGLFFLLFLLARVLLLLLYREDFSGLAAGAIARGFLKGLLFDASMICLVAGAPFLHFLLPVPAARHRRLSGLSLWYGYLAFVLFLAALAADLSYFGFVHRHVGVEVTAFTANLTLVLSIVFSDYWWGLLLVLGAAAALRPLWRRALAGAGPVPLRRPVAWALFAAGVIGVVLGIRGGLGAKRIHIVHAFDGGSVEEGYLALNGPFCALHSFRKVRGSNASFMAEAEAVRVVQGMLLPEGESAADPAYPLQRRARKGESRARNAVIILLESWDAHYTDVLRREAGLEPLGVTPNFDRLAREGVLFTRFYASGQRSVDGISAILSGIPTVPGVPYLGNGMEQSRLSYLGHLARQEGLATCFLRSANRSSYRLDAVAPLAGFDLYMGAEDILARRRVEPMTKWGVWDEDLFAEANRVFSESTRPFLGFLFTATTHAPYQARGETRRFSDHAGENRYLRSLHYVDATLGRFMEMARRAGYFEHTCFLITADHVSGVNPRRLTLPERMHIPCLVIGPGIEPRLDPYPGSQLDLMPTVIDLLGWGGSYASLGRSLFDAPDRERHGAFAVAGSLVLRIERDAWMAHSLRNRVEAHALGADVDLDAVERRLLATVQMATSLLRSNRVFRPE